MKRGAIVALCGVLAVAAGCALPFVEYPISPALSGRIEGPRLDGARVVLEVRSLHNADLGARLSTIVDSDGAFAFAGIALALAGREYGKHYSAYLRFERPGGEPSVVWRAGWDRRALADPVRLDCDLTRSTRHGQLCWVEHPTSHRWLVQLGKREYDRSCASCHGIGAAGNGPAAPTLASEPPDLTRIAARRGGRFDRLEMLAWVDGRVRPAAHGSREMPVWGPRLAREHEQYEQADDMAAARIDAVVTYLESLQRAGAPDE